MQPYDVPGGFNENFIRNSARLAEVWMDDYKDVYYFIRPQAKKVRRLGEDEFRGEGEEKPAIHRNRLFFSF
jgi:hypothetical protein